MKLIGAGFGRTGTMSLKAALERIGYGPTFHMIDLIRDPAPLPYWGAAVAGEPVDWEAAFAGWESTVDWPGCSFWEDYVELWPDAPVLLSVRDPDAWYDSCLKSIYTAKEMALRGELEGGSEEPPSPEVMQTISGLIWDGTFEGRFVDRDFAIGVFNAHNEAVKARVPEDRLIVWEPGGGWGPLCEPLGVEAPDEPFPHLNDTASFRAMFGMPEVAG
jgi:Sulfotransferase domain